ncbi:MAG: hypothetical protein V1745_02060 [Patescibacteria group bacterium]
MTTIRTFIAAATVFAACAAPLASHAAVQGGTLIKGATSPAVYFVEAGKRYAFPNERVFFSWYTDFTGVVTVPDAELASYRLAGNVTYRPGSQLVKVATDPKVYAVSRFGVLRRVMAESVASALYGSAWNTKVHDVADTFFTNYLVGSPIGAAADYNLNEERAIATISDDIRSVGYVAPTLPTTPVAPSESTGASISVGVSASQATLNQTILVFATVTGNTHDIATLELFSDQSASPLATCSRSTTCSFMYTVPQAPLNARFSAVATDDLGIRIVTSVGQQAALTVPAASSNLVMGVSPLSVTAGSRVSFTSDATRIQGIKSHKIYAVIPGEPNPILWDDCGIATLCASSSPFYRTTQLYSVVTFDGTTYQSPAVTVTVTSGTPPKPSLALTSRPTTNQAVLALSAPSGETIGWSTIVEGTSPDADALALCEYASCEITVQFSKTTTFTGFTDVGGKLEASNSITVTP